MPDSQAPLTVALLALPETTASTLYGIYDLFCSAGRDWALLMGTEPGPPPLRVATVSASTQAFQMANGVLIRPDMTFADCRRPDLVCIPDLFVAPDADISGRFAEAVEWLRAAHAGGATLAAACSGALLLAESGLLDGCEATTHWAYCDGLRAHYPAVAVNGSRVLVASGEGQRILTAGGGTSWQDMGLFLVARFLGQEEAMRLARLYLIDWHGIGQLPFSSLVGGRQVDDRAIAAAQVWLADHYAEPHAVAGMAAHSGLPDRSFKRRFRQATGMTPIDYVHTLRLEEAKQILETTDTPVEAIALDVGYEDASFFRRLFRRKVGLTPSHYRRRFGAVRRALGGGV